MNCGACGTTCAAGEICAASACVASCGTGLADCGGSCTNLSTDEANCGACGSTCGAGEVCIAGSCSFSCPGSLSNCGGSCIDTDIDPANCGGCGTTCAAGEICAGGSCSLACPSGQTNCSGICSDTSFDPANCGACGVTCGVAQACVTGTCRDLAWSAPMSVLVYYDSFGASEEPAALAANRMGATTVVSTGSASTFASEYDLGGWDIVVVNVPGSGLPAEVRSRVLDRISTGGLLSFSWWSLDGDAALATALGVSTTSFNSPRPIHPAMAATTNLFDLIETFPAPLTSSRDAGDNGDTLTLTSGGDVLCTVDSATGPNITVVTNGGKVMVNGFLPWDFQDTDNDTDGVTDMVELYVNQFAYLRGAR